MEDPLLESPSNPSMQLRRWSYKVDTHEIPDGFSALGGATGEGTDGAGRDMAKTSFSLGGTLLTLEPNITLVPEINAAIEQLELLLRKIAAQEAKSPACPYSPDKLEEMLKRCRHPNAAERALVMPDQEADIQAGWLSTSAAEILAAEMLGAWIRWAHEDQDGDDVMSQISDRALVVLRRLAEARISGKPNKEG